MTPWSVPVGAHGSSPARPPRLSARSNTPPKRATRSRSGSSAACMPKATVSRRTTQGVRVFPPHRRRPRRGQSRHAAGALRLQRLRRARPLLPRRHPEDRGQARSRSRPRNVRLCGVLFPRSRRAILSGPALSRRHRRAARSAPAARWFGLSAQKGQCQAQAMLGAMLFEGDHVPRQAARGLMWLTLAKESAARRSGSGSPSSMTAPSAGDRGRARAGRVYLRPAGWRRRE